jgi:succinylarginine dihydrolase
VPVEINFDGIIGPSHNYAGLSHGNLAATANEGLVSFPRAAALQGIAKMRHNVGLGLAQGILPPHRRPCRSWLGDLGTDVEHASDTLRRSAFSASAMWAANAATVSPAPDTADGRCHLTVANLRTMAHRSLEWPETLDQLRLAFADEQSFAVHGPVPATFGDEGAANHMRMAAGPAVPGIEIFVYGTSGGAFPVRQHEEASRAVARIHCLDPDRTLFAAQSEEAIAAGAFHNDVVAVANERVLFAHEQAYADKESLYASIRRLLPEAEIVEVPANRVSLADSVRSYLFNAQLVTLPGAAGIALILPEEARETPSVWAWLQEMIAGNGPIRHLLVVDVRQSMANGGGPACLRLRVVADPANVDPRFLVDARKLDRIAAIVEAEWPERIALEDLLDPALVPRIEAARARLLEGLELGELF